MTNIAVIGAGPSGIVMVKELAQLGFAVTCFEAGDTIGGVFVTAYDGCQLTSSTLTTQFSDFDDVASATPQIWTAEAYRAYLHRYIDHFKLIDYFQFSTRVKQVTPNPDGGYQLVICTEKGGNETRHFDRVAVCTGTHQQPLIPCFSGEETFQGSILHSTDYQNSTPFKGKRVLVVGGGESGSDISRDVAEVATASAISVRGKPGFLIPRFLLGQPADIETARTHYSFPTWWGNYYHPFRFLILLMLFTIQRFISAPKERAQARVYANWIKLQLRLHRNAFTRFGTKNLGMVEAMTWYGCELKQAIDYLDAQGAVFQDGSRFDCDVIICATGFRNRFPFLQDAYATHMDDLKVSRRLYKHCIHPQIGETLFFCGFARPAFGALPPVSEMQARWFALLTKGTVTLPSIVEMDRVIEEDYQKARTRFGLDIERITTLVDFLSYLDELAYLIDCFPPLDALKKQNPQLRRQVLLGPICTAQYRLQGSGANPIAAEAILMRLPVARSRIDMFALALFRNMSRLPGLGHFAPVATWAQKASKPH